MNPRILGYQTFPEIAGDLAKKRHGDLWRTFSDNYLSNLVRDSWGGRFHDDGKQSRLFYLSPGGEPEPITHEVLWHLIGRSDKPRDVREVLEGAPVPCEVLATKELEEYGVAAVCVFKNLALLEADARDWIQEYREKHPSNVADQRPEKRGRKQKYDWDVFQRAIVEIADKDSLPTMQAELENRMMEWCIKNWGDVPSESTIRSRVKEYYPRPYIEE